jgi:hypothetical protein
MYITKWWLPTCWGFQEVNRCVIGYGIMSSINYHCLPCILLYNVTVQNVLKWSIYFARPFTWRASESLLKIFRPGGPEDRGYWCHLVLLTLLVCSEHQQPRTLKFPFSITPLNHWRATILELILWKGRQSCHHITPDVINVIKMLSFQYFLYLQEQKKITGG